MKKTAKRFVALILIFAMLLAHGFSAFAEESVSIPETEQSISETFTNPLYADRLPEPNRKRSNRVESASTYAKAKYTTSEEEVVAQIREAMTKRQESIDIYYKVPEYKNGMVTELVKKAMVHTGKPKEGDYIFWQFENVDANGGYYTDSEGMCCIEVTYTITYFTNAEQEAAFDKRLEEVLEELDAADQNDYQKIKAIYNYICTHVEYDTENQDDDEYLLKHTAYAALLDGKAVCQGYALLFYRMALELGVDNRLIPGTGNSDTHGWNIVELNHIYYNVDTTWDAGESEYEFFLKCDANFVRHTRNDDYATDEFYEAYPMAEEDYTLPEICQSGEHQYQAFFDWEAVIDETGNVTGYARASAKVVCDLCGETHKNLDVTVALDEEKSTAPTCTEEGEDIYTATAVYLDKEYTENQTVILAAKGHVFGEWVVETAATKEAEGLKKRTCKACQLEETEVIPKEPIVQYQTHVQTYGWQDWAYDGEMSGTSGESKRLEGIRIQLYKPEYEGSITYRTHVQTYGWMAWTSDGEMNGTSGESKRLEAIQIKLTGEMAEHYDVYYRVHAQTYGWLDWAKNGEYAGTAGLSKRLEGIEIILVKKGGEAPGSTKKAYITSTGLSNKNYVTYRTHVQTYGWQDWMYDGVTSGTSGESKRLEAIQVKLVDPEAVGSIRYRTHVQTYGWQDWVTDGEASGTSGESKRLEAIRIELTSEMADQYDVYYRVHAQSFGWLGWAKNGEKAGTSGYSKRLEAIEIVLVEKGGEAPGNTDNCYKAK
ncbi:transglutaminase domain-containing protein [Coprococcus catus]